MIKCILHIVQTFFINLCHGRFNVPQMFNKSMYNIKDLIEPSKYFLNFIFLLNDFLDTFSMKETFYCNLVYEKL